MRQRRAEQGKDAIAQRLRHVAVILMHGVHHELQRRINNRSRLFGVQSFNQRRRALEIGEQRGDGFAFAVCATSGFQRRLLGPDALGQMGWRVGEWRGRAGDLRDGLGNCRWGRQRLATVPTGLGP